MCTITRSNDDCAQGQDMLISCLFQSMDLNKPLVWNKPPLWIWAIMTVHFNEQQFLTWHNLQMSYSISLSGLYVSRLSVFLIVYMVAILWHYLPLIIPSISSLSCVSNSFVIRMKEYERERRLLERGKRKRIREEKEALAAWCLLYRIGTVFSRVLCVHVANKMTIQWIQLTLAPVCSVLMSSEPIRPVVHVPSPRTTVVTSLKFQKRRSFNWDMYGDMK